MTCIVDSFYNWHRVNLHSMYVWYAAHLDRIAHEMRYAGRRRVFSMHAWSTWRSTTQDYLLQLSGIGWPCVPTSAVFYGVATHTMQETRPTQDAQHCDQIDWFSMINPWINMQKPRQTRYWCFWCDVYKQFESCYLTILVDKYQYLTRKKKKKNSFSVYTSFWIIILVYRVVYAASRKCGICSIQNVGYNSTQQSGICYIENCGIYSS